MANKRSEGQELVTLWMDNELVQAIEEARGPNGRSQFIREAIAERLAAMGLRVSPNKTTSPDRMGKGGRILRYPSATKDTAHLNEKAQGTSSKPTSPAGKLLKKAVAAAKHPAPK